MQALQPKTVVRKQFQEKLRSYRPTVDWGGVIERAKTMLPNGWNGLWATYAALPSEIDPSPFVDHFQNVQWAYPRVSGEDLDFYCPQSDEDFEVNRWQIKEPIPSQCEKIDPAQLQGLLVPGVAFDRLCQRLGRGKGFYDKTLNRCAQALKVGLGYSLQISETALPVEEHDVVLDFVLTDTELITRRKEK